MKYEVTAKRLRFALERNDMKAQELADRTGIHKSSISQYVNGSHSPGNVSAGKMANILGVSPVWLMGFDVPMFDTKKQPGEIGIGAERESLNRVELMACFEQMDAKSRERMLSFARKLLDVQKMEDL